MLKNSLADKVAVQILKNFGFLFVVSSNINAKYSFNAFMVYKPY